jgi:2-polyprenyl-3-methyl-5-hydroxy-6-metoxy-1,4-benzoquinol methylase
MRIGGIPEGLLEKLLNSARLLPSPLIETLGAMAVCRTIMAGNRLGVFEFLSRGPQSAETISKTLSCHQPGMEALLEALAASGYLKRRGALYANSLTAKRWLSPDSPYSPSHYLNLDYLQWSWWERLEEMVRTGKTVDLHLSLKGNPDAWKVYLLGLKDLAAWASREILRRVRPPRGAKLLLDLGGGHGGYSEAVCRKYSAMKAVVFDLPEACSVGMELVHRSGLQDRIRFIPGDLAQDNLDEKITGGGLRYDFVFMFNILHHFDAKMNRSSLKKIFTTINPGGRLVILDLFKRPDDRRQLPMLATLFFMITSGGGIYSYDETKRWLTEARFERCRMLNLLSVPGASLVVADKPGLSEKII